MKSVEIKRTKMQGTGSEIRTPVADFRDVFYKSSNRCKRIFYTSEAGQGKTAFCKYLVLAWCNAHDRNIEELGHFKSVDLDIMQEFEFVFLILLRDSYAADCDVDDMIQNHIVQYLSRSFRYSEDVVQTLLHRESSLIILDGLDEWSHPDPKLSHCRRIPDYLPHRKVRERCTILTTTRSWKLSIANFKSSQIDKHIHIESLSYEASKQLLRNAVTKINRNILTNLDNVKPDIDKVTAEIRSKSIHEFEVNPLILTYLICLWCEGKPVGDSKCDVYSEVLELLVLRTKEKCLNIEIISSTGNITLPSCFKNKNHMKACFGVLINLGRLAFEAFFSPNKERSLVFDASFMNGILSKDTYEFSLSTGLLVQNKVPGQLTSRTSRTSFSHKTFQEFFAALYIQSQTDLTRVAQQVMEKCDSVENILEMSNVFIFLSGLDHEKLSVLSKNLCVSVDNDVITTTYRREQLAYFRSKERLFKDLQNMYIACVRESTDSQHCSIHLTTDDFIIDKECDDDNYFRMLSNLILMNIDRVKSVALYHCASEIGSRELISRLRLAEIQTLERLCLRCPIDFENLKQLLSCSVATMKQLTIHGLVWKNNRLYPVYNSLSGTTINSVLDLKNLESMSLVNIQLPHYDLEQLTKALSERIQMKQITLYDIKCIDHEQNCTGVQVDLSQLYQLKFAGFGKVSLSDVKIQTSQLEECAVGELQNRNALSSFLTSLQRACKLQRLSCSEVDSGLDLVLDTIPVLVHLQHLIMYDIKMTNSGIRISAGMEGIEFILIEDAEMTSSSLEQLVHDLEQLKQTVKVQLHDCSVSPPEEYERVKNYVKMSSKFEVLDDGKVKTVLGEEYNGFVFEKIKLKEQNRN